MKTVSKYDDFARIKNFSWLQEIFIRSKNVEGTIIQAGKGEDVLVSDEGYKNAPQTKRVMGKYPDLGETKGQYTQLHLTRMRDSEGKESTKEQIVKYIIQERKAPSPA